MAKFSIIKVGPRQYKVSKGDIINIDQLDKKEGSKIVFEEVLLVYDEGKVEVGLPNVSKQTVEGKVLGEVKGKKIDILTYKAKARYRRNKGHRAKFTKVEITKI